MGRVSNSKQRADQARFTNRRSVVRTRKLYSAERLGVYLGLNISAEMHAE